MTGRSNSGKISIRVRNKARIEVRASATTMTITEIGRLSAARMSHMSLFLLLQNLWLCKLRQERSEIAASGSNTSQSTPDIQSRHCVIGLGLGQKTLRRCDLHDCRQPGLKTGTLLLLTRTRRSQLHGCV